MSSERSDITLPPDLSQKSGTGPVRLQEPVYVDSIPPCNHACPAGENIQAWLDKAQAGEFEAAFRILVENNPMPSIHGRVCYHPCESACNRGQVDDSVSIHAVERFLGDLALAAGWLPEITAPASGKKILVVGAGPSGLSAAFHLRLMGHEVEIRDAGPMAGGMMRFGIPAYRMPRDELAAEIRRIEDLGVKITLNHRVDDVLAVVVVLLPVRPAVRALPRPAAQRVELFISAIRRCLSRSGADMDRRKSRRSLPMN